MQKTKERPIVLNAKEVNAVLLGKKTQHRIPALTNEQIGAGYKVCYGVASGQVVFTKDENDDSFGNDDYLTVNCPFGSVSDRLWVRETHHVPDFLYDYEQDELARGLITRDSLGMSYKADAPHMTPADGGWSSPVAMPRWASRLLLEITDIRIECVQDIKLGDSLKEGCTGLMDFAADYWMPKHGEAAWFTDPWVWVIEFKKLKGKAHANTTK